MDHVAFLGTKTQKWACMMKAWGVCSYYGDTRDATESAVQGIVMVVRPACLATPRQHSTLAYHFKCMHLHLQLWLRVVPAY